MFIGPGLPDTAFFPRRRIAFNNFDFTKGAFLKAHGLPEAAAAPISCLEFCDASVPRMEAREATQKADAKSAKCAT